MRHRLERLVKRVVAAILRVLVGSRRLTGPLPATFERILVVRQHNQLGDMLCAIPLLRALRERFPHARIVLVAAPVNFGIMLHSRFLDAVLCFDKRRLLEEGLRGVGNLVTFVRQLRAEKFDLAIVPSTVSVSFTSDLLALLSGARVRIGAKSLNGRENLSAFCFNVPIDLDWTDEPDRHQTLRNLDFAKPLGIASSNLALEISFSLEEQNSVYPPLVINKLLVERSRYIFYHPGAGKPANRWPASRFAQVANELGREPDVVTWIIEGPMDRLPVEEMLQHVVVPYVLLRDRWIRDVAMWLSLADLVITNDTGIMHVAAGVGAPVLSLFGPTSPEQWAPIGEKNRFIRGKGGDINALDPGDVIELAKQMLASQSDG